MTGPDIKNWRAALGENRAWLAEKCGVSSRTVEAWEQGIRTPSGPALLLLERLVSETDPNKRKPKDGNH